MKHEGPGSRPTGSTPILDRLAPMPPPAAPGSAMGIVLVSLGCIALVGGALALWRPPAVVEIWHRGVTCVVEMLEQPWSPSRIAIAVTTSVLAGFAAVFVHEFGHVLAGLAAGFRFDAMSVGPIQFERPFRVSRHRGPLTWAGGWVHMFPIVRDHQRVRALVLVAAGPVACIVSGFVVLALPFEKGPASVLFVMGSLANVLELLPIRSGPVAFDGWRIWKLLWNRAWAERWLALMSLDAAIRAGSLPEALPADDLARALALRDDSLDSLLAHAFAFSSAFHRREDADAGSMLEECLSRCGRAAPVLHEALMSDAAVFQARRRKRADLAEQWLALLPEKTGAPGLRARAEAAILEARGDVPGALGKLEEYEDAVRAVANPVRLEVILRLLNRWRAELGAA